MKAHIVYGLEEEQGISSIYKVFLSKEKAESFTDKKSNELHKYSSTVCDVEEFEVEE